KSRARRTPGQWRARHIRQMRLLPGAGHIILVRRQDIKRVMEPAIPAWRSHRALSFASIDHPAPLEPKGRIDSAAARAVISVAVAVSADKLAIETRMEQRVERGAIPPGEKSGEPLQHRFEPLKPFRRAKFL